MLVQSLGYVGLRAKDIEDWSGYGTRLLGLQAVDRSRATLALRMDDRKQRLIVNADGGEGIGFFGWEVGRRRRARTAGGASRLPRRRGGARRARARRGAPGRRSSRGARSPGQPAGILPWRRGRRRSVRARTQHLRVPHRHARPRPRGPSCGADRGDDGVLPRHPRVPSQRLFPAALRALFLPREPAPPQHRLCRHRQERGPPHDAGTVQLRRCRPGLRPRRAARQAGKRAGLP